MGNINELLGVELQPLDLQLHQVVLRGLLVFIVALILVRVADRRFLGQLSAFDALLGFMLGSMLSRAINGTAPFWPTLAAGVVLVVVHRFIGNLAFHSDAFGSLVKGNAKVLVRDGKMDHDALRRKKISKQDLLEEARLNDHIEKLEAISLATLERNGTISVLPRNS